MYRFRISLAALAAVALILTGSVAMQMRAAPGPAGQIIICTGQGPVSIQVGPDGQPTGAVHICPECMLHGLNAVLAETFQAPRPVVITAVVTETLQAVSGTLARPVPQARAPPNA
jgi:hypothetical protein